MADENLNTTGTENSTQTATDDASASTSQSSSTTEAQSTPTPDADKTGDEQKGSTLLTGADAPEDDTTGDEAKTDDTPPNPLLGAPEGDYEIDLGDTKVDTEALAFVAPLAKEIGLSQEGMNKLVGVYAEQVLPHVTNSFVKQMEADVAAQRRDWDAQTRLAIAGGKDAEGKDVAPDPDFQGKPLDEVVATAGKAIRKLGGDDFAQFLETTGMGNDPRMVKFAFRAGAAISEDTTFDRGAPGAKPQSKAELFYGPKT